MTTFHEYDEFFETLEIPETADHADVKAAYRSKLQTYCSSNGPQCKEELACIQEAYRVLSNPVLRCQYADFIASGKQGATEVLVKPGFAPSGMLMAQGTIDRQPVNAIPDTGAGCNLVSSSLAKRLGFEPPLGLSETQGISLRMANGKTIIAAGTVHAAWRFACDPDESWNIAFQVINDFAHDVVLGSEFLISSGTMKQHSARLSRAPRPPWATSVLFTNSIGSVSQRLRGRIGGVEVDALADSGSESNLVSLNFARHHREWRETIDWRDQRLLRFPDGKMEKTAGSVWAHWTYMKQSGSHSSCDDAAFQFHILRGCVHEVILGQDALEEIEAFTEHSASFVKIDERVKLRSRMKTNKRAVPLDFNLVIWLPAKRPKVTDAASAPLQNQQTSNELQEIPPQSQMSQNPTGPRSSNISAPQNAEQAAHLEWSERLTDYKQQVSALRKFKRMPRGPDKDAVYGIIFKTMAKLRAYKHPPVRDHEPAHELSAAEMRGEAWTNLGSGLL